MKDELKNIIEKCGFYNLPGRLYNDLIILDKKSNFNLKEFIKFMVLFPSVTDGTIDLSQLKDKLNKVDSLSDDKLNNFRDRIEAIDKKLDSFNEGWISVEAYHDDVKQSNDNKGESGVYIKIYLSVDNSTLHLFANQFILSCVKYGYDDFSFKVNKVENINRRDNVVIYCTDKNLGKYVSLVQEVIENNKLNFNSPHLLGTPYDEHIYCGIDNVSDGTSYSDLICDEIIDNLNAGKNINKILKEIDKRKLKVSSTIDTIMRNNYSVRKH